MSAKVVMVRAHPVDPDVRVEKEAKSLSEAGYTVTVLCWGRYGNNRLSIEKRSGYHIRRFQLPAPWGVRVIFFLPLWWLFELIWLLRNDWDIVHAADLDTYIPALIIAKIRRKPIIYDIYDFYADQISLPGKNIIAKLDRELIKFADSLIIVDPSRLKQIGKIKDSSVTIIYNSPPNHVDAEAPIQKGRGGAFKLFYAGVLSMDRDFKSIIDASTSIGDLSLEIAGYGHYGRQLEEHALNNPSVKYLGPIMYDVVIEKSLQADLLFALYDPSVQNNKYASPNKLFEAMMCSKPILVSEGTSMAEIVRAENCGLVVPYMDTLAVIRAISMLMENRELCNQLGKNGRKAYLNKYSWQIMENKLLGVYKDLISNAD